MKLGVNIDHVATLRQARYKDLKRVLPWAEPDLLTAVRSVEHAGAHGITIHLREDRRHIQDSDVFLVKKKSKLPLNLEMANSPEIVRIALKVKPEDVCIVPERRQEVTTEGGLDVVRGGKTLRQTITKLQRKGIVVSLFIAPDPKQIRAAAVSGAEFIELHTGAYADARSPKQRNRELSRIAGGAALARSLGLRVNAGHGLRTTNVRPILHVRPIEVLNIGHSIVSRSIAVGLETAVREMLRIISLKL
jgi:pyridoxine 5-phosphate synthase